MIINFQIPASADLLTLINSLNDRLLQSNEVTQQDLQAFILERFGTNQLYEIRLLFENNIFSMSENRRNAENHLNVLDFILNNSSRHAFLRNARSPTRSPIVSNNAVIFDRTGDPSFRVVAYRANNRRIQGTRTRQQGTRQRSARRVPQIPSTTCKESFDCAICYETVPVEHTICILKCRHKFHKTCLFEWAKRQANCPLCRASIF